MICQPCARAADRERAYQAVTGVPSGLRRTHPADCGCPCQHRPLTPR